MEHYEMTEKYSAPMSFKAKAGPTIKWGLGITTALVGTTVGLGIGLSLLAGYKTGQSKDKAAGEAIIPDITALNDIGWFVSNSLGLSVALVAGGATILLAVQSWILSQNQMRLAAQEFLSDDLKRMRETASISQDLVFKFAKSTLNYAEQVREYACVTSLGVFAGSGGTIVDGYEVASKADLPKIVSAHTLAKEREDAIEEIMKAIKEYQPEYDDGSDLIAIEEVIIKRFNQIFSDGNQADLKKSLDNYMAETVARQIDKQLTAAISDRGRLMVERVKQARIEWLDALYSIVSHLTNPQVDPISRAIWQYNLQQSEAAELIKRIEQRIDSVFNIDEVDNGWWGNETLHADAKPESPTIGIFRKIEAALQGPAIVDVDRLEADSDWFISFYPSRYLSESTSQVYKYLPRLGVVGDLGWNAEDARPSPHDPQIYLFTNYGSEWLLDEKAKLKNKPPKLVSNPNAGDGVPKFEFFKHAMETEDESDLVGAYTSREEHGRSLLRAVRDSDEHDFLGDVSELLRLATSKQHSEKAIREYLKGSVANDLVDAIISANEKYIPRDVFDDIANKPTAVMKKTNTQPKPPAPPSPPVNVRPLKVVEVPANPKR